jgi:hypothetical protein
MLSSSAIIAPCDIDESFEIHLRDLNEYAKAENISTKVPRNPTLIKTSNVSRKNRQKRDPHLMVVTQMQSVAEILGHSGDSMVGRKNLRSSISIRLL